MSADHLEETMSSSLQIIDDDCLTIDNIYKYLEELENQGDLTLHVKNHIQDIKFELRNFKIHLKWRTFSDAILIDLRSWLEELEEFLLQPTRKGCITADLLEEKIFDLLKKMRWEKSELSRTYGFDEFPCNLDYMTNALVDDVLEWIDPLLDYLKHHIRWNEHSSIVFAKEQNETLIEKLGFLRNFLEIAGRELEEVIKNGTSMPGILLKASEDILTRIKRLIPNALYESWFSWDYEEGRWRDKFFLILQANIDHIEPEIRMIYVQLLKASRIANPRTLGIELQAVKALAAVDSLVDNLQKLLKDKDTGSFMHLDVHPIEILCEELCFLKYFLLDPRVKHLNDIEAQSFNSLLIQVEAVARELGASLTLSVCVGRTKDDFTDEMNLFLPNLLKILNLLKIKIRQMYLRIPKESTSNFPRCPKLSFVNFVIQSLEELLQHKADSIAYVKNEVRTLQSELTLLNSLIESTTKYLEKNENVASRIVDVAYEAKHVTDLISTSHFPKWYYILWLSDIIENIKILRKDCSEIHTKMTSEISILESASSTNYPSPAYNLAIEEEMVGFHAEAEIIIDQLTSSTKQLDILSIVGMPGQGKTTLAKKVYAHPSITRYFHVRSWYCISQVYDRKGLLRTLCGRPSKSNDEDLDIVLYRSLKGKRYFIVLDDIWSIEPWNDIRNSFPDDCNGSRILFTSRNREVALQANPRCAPHDLRLFSDEESWELLHNKVFKKRSNHHRIFTIGKKIANNCKGLPLSVSLVAGVLVKLEESEDKWKQVLASLGKQVGELSKCILELSYKNLPDHLRPCFLYFGVFPEDEKIPTWKLIRMWIAEGFIQKTKYGSLENVAEGYLMALIRRSLVLIAERNSNGGVKSCQLHDLLHEFCKEKAKDDNFLLISREMPYDLGQYRHCFYYNTKFINGWMPYDRYVRSVFFYQIGYAYISCWDSLLVLSYSLKLLRVLDLQDIYITEYQFQRLTELLVDLRYLAIQSRLTRIPSSVANLWRLETFILMRSSCPVLPEAFLEMAYLKHVFVDSSHVRFKLSDHPEKSIKSACIENLSTLCLDDLRIEEVMRRLRCLKKLKCVFTDMFHYIDCYHKFALLDLLSELESLSITYYCTDDTPSSEFSFPSNLKKLTLSRLGLPWSKISKIGRLPQLKVLKLCYNSFMGRRWDVSDDEFRNLKFLKLEELDIEEWDASPNAFPFLEQLVVKDCKLLKKIPSSFEESSTLRMIVVEKCRNSVTKSVLKIKKEQQELVAVGFELHIKNPLPPSDSDSDSDPESDVN